MRFDRISPLAVLLATLHCAPLQAASVQGADLWRDHDAAAAAGVAPGADWIRPQAYRGVTLARDGLDALLAAARGGPERTTLALPHPDGGFEAFRIREDAVMAPELAAWMAAQGYPMRTFAGESLARPGTTVRLDWGGPRGFHASVLGANGVRWFIDPRFTGDTQHYASYHARAAAPRSEPRSCSATGRALDAASLDGEFEAQAFTPANTGGARRTYRLAMAATGEYTAFHGGTKALAQAAIVTTVNRVNQIYLRDLAVFMTLVANNQNVVYTNAGNDPYSNNNGDAMLGQNQNTLDSIIGGGNYDVGHVVSTGGGGVALLGVPCRTNTKAQGVTGSSQPVGDGFDIDYVAHEIGHQFGADHTFNSVTSSCGGGNRSGNDAYEPGSGSTIMAYAGICGADNLQAHSDAVFHYRSLAQILAYTGGSAGNACSVKTPNVNPAAPTANAGADHVIPLRTPFELTASGNDADTPGSLTWLWEQYDLGPARTLANGDGGSGPIVRSFAPVNSATRSVPRLTTVLGTQGAAKGEILPTTARTLTFRVTARDNDADGGRVGTDTMTVTTVAGTGPFRVTAPNGGETASGSVNVTWAVAGTAGGSIATAAVDIYLSTNNGQSFAPLLLNTPNDGAATAPLPAGTSSNAARIKVRGRGNIFYDISDAAFTAIAGSSGGPDPFAFADVAGAAPGVAVISGWITISGLSAPAAIGVSGHNSASYEIEGQAPTRDAGTVANGKRVRLRLRSSANADATRSATLDVGGVTDTWNVTTR